MGRLDGLRGVLAVYVMLGHALPFTALPGWLIGPARHGEAAVDLFFCLSGLVVINSLERFGYATLPFLLARARRLLPVYWVVLAASVVMLAWGSPLPEMGWIGPGSVAANFWAVGLPAQFWAHLAAHIVLLHGVIPQGWLPWAFVTLLGPAWSLSTEWQFYLLLAAAMRPRRRPGLPALAYALAALAVVYRLAAPCLPSGWQFSRAFLPDAAGYFALGLASAAWLRGAGGQALIMTATIAAALGAASIDPWRALIPAGWLLALLSQRSNAVPLIGQLLDRREVRFLGKISYPIYLVNEPIQRAAALLAAPLAHGNPQAFTILWLPPALAAPLLAATVLHLGIERRKQGLGGFAPLDPPLRAEPLEPNSVWGAGSKGSPLGGGPGGGAPWPYVPPPDP
jgi:peptidoglycan/LPS O-acetylase OafA/YrhL